MAGRTDDASLEVAVAKVSEAVPYAPEFLRQLETILASSAFRGSRRSQEFLRHVVELALHGEFERLKERIIGIEIFHRHADYDTGDDAIVRVTASDVRRRLAQFYAEDRSSEYRIELPAGSYIPEFRHVTAPLPVSKVALLPMVEVEEVSPAQHPEHITETSPVEPVSELPIEPLKRPRTLILAAICVAALLLCLGWIAGTFSANRPSGSDRARYSFYKELLGPIASDPRMETEIVLSNPRLLLYRGSDVPDPNEDVDSLKISLPPPLAAELASAANDNQAGFPYHRLVLDTEDYTGLGEAKAAFHIGSLLDMLGRPAHLSEARFLNWDIARSQHFIILGAPHMSVWTQSSLERAPFTMEHDQIRNNHPIQGEPAVYPRTGQPTDLEDYGLIWMSKLPSGSRILVLAGLTSAGTAGVGSFFADPAAMRPVYEQLKKTSAGNTFPTDWQALIRINVRENVPVKVSLVSVRTFDTK